MPHSCLAYGCTNISGRDNTKGKSFHNVPLTKPVLLAAWMKQLNKSRGNKSPIRLNKYSRICSDHFEPNCFEKNGLGGRWRLKCNAVPTRFAIVAKKPSSTVRTVSEEREISKSSGGNTAKNQNGSKPNIQHKQEKKPLQPQEPETSTSSKGNEEDDPELMDCQDADMDEKPVSQRMLCSALPKGWMRELVMRRTGLSAGRSDVYYYSPDGKKVRSKPQLEKVLGDDWDLSNFDFRTGCFTRRSKRKQASEQSFSRDLGSGILPAPLRQSTTSFSKQPVTYYPTMVNMASKKQKLESKVNKEKPKQLFWEKRLQGLSATNPTNCSTINGFSLPKGFKLIGPRIDEKSLIHSLVTKLHNNSNVKGQDRSMISLEKHPEVWINAEQPLCAPFSISEADIKEQEERVAHVRRQLTEALTEYEIVKRSCPIN